MIVKLNENEKAVFAALAQEIQNCTAGEFGFASDMKLPEGITKKQVSGYVSQLCQKELFSVDSEFQQVLIDEANFFDTAKEYGVCVGKSFCGWSGTWQEVGELMDVETPKQFEARQQTIKYLQARKAKLAQEIKSLQEELEYVEAELVRMDA